APVGVEAERGADRDAQSRSAFYGRLQFLQRRQGFDPEHIRPGLRQRTGLLAEDRHPLLVGQWAERLKQVTGWSDAAGYRDRSAYPGRSPASHLDRGLVEFDDSPLEPMQGEATGIASEGVGQDDVGPGGDEALVHRLDELRLFDVQ